MGAFKLGSNFCCVILLTALVECSAHNISIGHINSTTHHVLCKRFTYFLYTVSTKYISAKKEIYVIFPSERNNPNMVEIFNEAVYNLSNYWSVVTNDSCSCHPPDKWVLSYDTRESIMYSPDMYVISIDYRKDFRCFEIQLQLLERVDKFNHRAIFIIVYKINESFTTYNGRNYTGRIFQQMWSINLFASVVIIISEFDNYLTVVTARPYSLENPCGQIGENGLKYTSLNMENNKHHDIELTLFPEGPNHMEGCVFTAGTAPFSPYVVGQKSILNNETHLEFIGGIDIELMRVFSAKKGFKYEFYKTHTLELSAWFEILENGSIVGILSETLFHNVDIAFGGLIPSYVSYNKYDYSPSYKFSAVSLYVTDAKVIPQWKVFFGTFPLEVWVVLITTFFVVFILYRSMGQWKFRGMKTNDSNFRGLLPAQLLSILLGFSSTLYPRSSYLRVLFYSWALYGMHWYIAYTTVLFTLLTNPPYEKEITSIEELITSGLKVKTDPLYIEYFAHIELDKSTKSVFDHSILCYTVETCISDLVYYRNFSVMEKEENVELRVNMKQSKIHKLEDKVLSFSVSAFTDKGSILSPELNHIVLLCFQAGLFFKWENDVMLYHHNIKETEANVEELTSTLSVHDLKGAFFLLMFGLIVSFLVCVGEVVYHSLKRVEQKQVSKGLRQRC